MIKLGIFEKQNVNVIIELYFKTVTSGRAVAWDVCKISYLQLEAYGDQKNYLVEVITA